MQRVISVLSGYVFYDMIVLQHMKIWMIMEEHMIKDIDDCGRAYDN